jgi:cell division protein FtsB
MVGAVLETVGGLLRGRWIAVGLTLTLAYFGYHALHGRYGFLAYIDTSRQLEVANQELVAVEREFALVEADVAAFQPDSLDRDRLEEQLRLLGYVRPNEVIVLRREDASEQ